MARLDEGRRAARSCRLIAIFVVALFFASTWFLTSIALTSTRRPSFSSGLDGTRVTLRDNRFESGAPKAKSRRYPIFEPKPIGGASRSRAPPPTGRSPADAGFPLEFQEFVRVGPGGTLVLGDVPFFVTGFNNYYVHVRSAWVDTRGGRHEVDAIFQAAQALGMNVLRCWAFSDGDEWNALQPEQGIIDERSFREGLDYVVAEARKYGIRLILTLTNGQRAYGGMQQYVKWIHGTTISEFYTDSTIIRAFKDYVYTVLHRKNTIDQVLYKDNPTILGWDIANEPSDPGHPGSEALQSWVAKMSAFIKFHDPDHLVMVGWEGFFGDSTPERTVYNAYLHNFSPLSEMSYRHDDVCYGTDFYRNHLPESIDLCVAHLYPDSWASCDHDCKMDFARKWIRQHLEVAAELGRPFLLGEFGSQKPMAHRNDFYRLVHSELLHAAKLGYPVAGSLLWMLSAPTYPDYDGFTIYQEESAVQKSRPRVSLLSETYPVNGTMWNHELLMECFMERAEKSVTETGEHWNEGWNDTLEIIQNYTQAAKETVIPSEQGSPAGDVGHE